MPTEFIPVKPYATKFGSLFGSYSILILVLLYVFNQDTGTVFSILNFIITISIVWYAIHLYKIDNGGLLDLTTSIKLALGVGVIGGLIYGIYTFLHYNFVEPEYILEMKINMEAEMEAQIQQQQMSAEEAEMTRNMSGVFASPFVLGTIGLLSIIFKTFIVGLVVGMIKKNN
jgi:hypothetical protein